MASAIEYGLIAALISVAGITAAQTVNPPKPFADKPLGAYELTLEVDTGKKHDDYAVDGFPTMGDCMDALLRQTAGGTFYGPEGKPILARAGWSCRKANPLAG